MKYYAKGQSVAIRKAFGLALLNEMRRDEKVVALSADLGGSLGMDVIGEEFPERYFNTGVAEQNMIGIAAGLALEGHVPFAGSFGCFLERTMDHVRQAVLHNGANVKIVGSHGGVSNAMDGPSAHALEDLAFFRAFPSSKLAVVVLSDPNQAFKAVRQVAKWGTAVYLRLYREPLPVFTEKSTPFTIGKANVLQKGKDVTVVACGPHVGFALEVAGEMAGHHSAPGRRKSVDIEVIDNHTLAPFDKRTLVRSAKKTGRVVSVEDHSINGGLGSAVAEVLGEDYPTRLVRVGLRDFATTGDYHSVIEYAGIGKRDIKKAIKRLLNTSR